MKLARYVTRRTNIIAFLGAFHGRTLGALSLTASKAIQRRGFGPMAPGVFHAPYPDCYRCPIGLKPESCAAECLGFLENEIFLHLVSPDEIAAIFVEPIQGEGGYVVAPDQFLQRLRELTRTYGILLVVDEVQSGMGRTGRMFAIARSAAMMTGISSGRQPAMAAFTATFSTVASPLPGGSRHTTSSLSPSTPPINSSTAFRVGGHSG